MDLFVETLDLKAKIIVDKLTSKPNIQGEYIDLNSPDTNNDIVQNGCRC